jgi:hypothetical protein
MNYSSDLLVYLLFMRENAVWSKWRWRAKLAKNETTVSEVAGRSTAARKIPIAPRDERHSDDDHGIVMDDNNISKGV